MAEASVESAVAPKVRGSTRSGGLLAVVLPGVFIAILDTTIVNVAVPSIQTDLHTSGAALQLVVGAYVLAYAVLLITGARLGDLAGQRRTFLAGVALFTFASLACGLAWSVVALICFRLIQGVGAALMVPQVISLIQRHFEGQARARAFGWYAAVIAGGAIAGQIAGGVLVGANLFGSQWRSVFLVNVPIGVALLVAGSRRLPHDRGQPGRGLDLPGVLALSAAMFALVLPLVLGHETGWPPWTWLSLAASVVMIVLFALLERRAGRLGCEPLINGRLLRTPGMAAGAVAILFALGNYAGILFLLSNHVQAGLGYGPLAAGLVFLPSAIAFAPTSLFWRRLPARWHRGMVPAGLVLSGLALVGLAFSARGGDISLGMELAIMFFGTGMGFAFSPMFAFALARVPLDNAADASGVLTTVNQLGQVIGVATYGTVFFSLFHTPADSPHAAMVTALAMAVGAVLAAAAALRLPSMPSSPE